MTELPRLKQDLVDAAGREAARRSPRPRLVRQALALVAAVVVLALVGVTVSSVDEPSDDVEVPVASATPQGDDCRPLERLLTAVAALRAPSPRNGVPPEVTGAVRESRLVTRDARLWGQADGVAYWVTPRLRCDEPDLRTDQVCIIPVRERDDTGVPYCSAVNSVKPGNRYIHFPLEDGRAAIAGFAPPDVRRAVVRIVPGGIQSFRVRGGVWGGTLDGRVGGEVGGATVAFDRDPGTEAVAAGDRAEVDGAVVSVLNATSRRGLGQAVVEDLEARLGARRGRIGNWISQAEAETVVLSVGDPAPAEVIGRHLEAPVRPADDQARKRAGSNADVIVVAGRDAAD